MRADLGADDGRLVVNLEDMLGRGGEANAVTDLRVLALGHPLDGQAEGLRLLFDEVDVLGVFDLEAVLDDTDAAFLVALLLLVPACAKPSTTIRVASPSPPLDPPVTVFFEFIQRKKDEGFGEGNFTALFKSMEMDQIRRGALNVTEPAE